MRSLCLIAAVAALVACDPATGPKGVVVMPADGLSLDSLSGRDSAGDGVVADVAAGDAVGDAKPGADADSGEVGGSRLKRRWIVAEDGTREAAGWFDSEIGTLCAFAPVGGGDYRCLPSIADPQVIEGEPALAVIPGTFSDAECAHRIIRAPAWLTCAPLIVSDAQTTALVTPGECGRPRAVGAYFRVDGPADVADGAPTYRWSLAAEPTCVPADPASGQHYSVGAELPAGAFVRASAHVGE